MKTVFLLSDEENGMTITQLKYVITVAESNSMNEAAGKLFISQPSLSASIKELEDSIAYIDWKQNFYDEVLSGKRAYVSNLIQAKE